MNSWGIPVWLEKEVKERYTNCVYCGVELVEKMLPNGSRKNAATWEHIINDEKIITRENITRCCVSCNASKGTKALKDWLNSNYCRNKGITSNSVAQIIKNALKKNA